jgi:hypothetical protein
LVWQVWESSAVHGRVGQLMAASEMSLLTAAVESTGDQLEEAFDLASHDFFIE